MKRLDPFVAPNIQTAAPDVSLHGTAPLREKALRWLREQPVHPMMDSTAGMGVQEPQHILEELRIYQAELEVQNEELRASQERTERLLQRFSMLFSRAPICMLLVDRFGVVKEANAAASATFRLSGHPTRHHLMSRLVADSSRHMIESGLLRAESNTSPDVTITLNGVEMIDGSGQLRCGDLSLMRLPVNFSGAEDEFVCVYSDHTELSRLMSELSQQNDRLRLYAQAFDQVSDAILVTDLQGYMLFVNRAFTRITGYEPDEIVGQHSRTLGSGHTAAETYAQLWTSLESTGEWEGELSNRRSDGALYPEWISIKTLNDDQGQPWRYVATFRDLTQHRAQEEALRQLAQEDALTGLPNRHVMSSLVNRAFERARRSGSKVGMMFVDVDNFKSINDSLGHLIGDETLVQFSRRIRKRLRDTDTLIRMGGDEFLIIAEQLNNASNASELAQSILEAMAFPLKLPQGREIFVTCSMGIGIFPDDGENVEQLLQESDTAMYRAKSVGRNRYEFFSPSLMERVQDEFKITTDLRFALKRAELFLEFQPLVPSVPGQPFEVEALVRWRHPDKQVLYPGSFIEIAERAGLIQELSVQVLHESCRAMRRMLDAGLPVSEVAVNVSFRDLESKKLAELVKSVLLQYDLRGEHLKLELTERDIMRDVEHTRQALDELRQLGVRIAVDDFGTGFSSLAYLRILPLDTLKIDASFVAAMEAEGNSRSIVETIVSLGKALHLHLVAEGVETEGQAELLKALGVDYLQGWLYSKSIPESQLAGTLQQLRQTFNI